MTSHAARCASTTTPFYHITIQDILVFRHGTWAGSSSVGFGGLEGTRFPFLPFCLFSFFPHLLYLVSLGVAVSFPIRVFNSGFALRLALCFWFSLCAIDHTRNRSIAFPISTHSNPFSFLGCFLFFFLLSFYFRLSCSVG